MTWFTAAMIGLALVVLGSWFAWREHRWLSKANIVEGKVVRMVGSSGLKGGSVSAPHVTFTALDGSPREFKSSQSSSSPEFKVGQKVWVAYDDQFADAYILTFGERFGGCVLIIAIGIALTVGASLFIAGKKVVPDIYLSSHRQAE